MTRLSQSAFARLGDRLRQFETHGARELLSIALGRGVLEATQATDAQLALTMDMALLSKVNLLLGKTISTFASNVAAMQQCHAHGGSSGTRSAVLF